MSSEDTEPQEALAENANVNFSFENPLAEISKILSAFGTAKALDANGDKIPDFINLASYAGVILAELSVFAPKVKTLPLLELGAEATAMFATIEAAVGPATELVQEDIAILKGKYPDLFPELPAPPAKK